MSQNEAQTLQGWFKLVLLRVFLEFYIMQIASDDVKLTENP